MAGYVQLENLTGNAVYGMDRTTVIILNDDVFPQGVEDIVKVDTKGGV